MCLRRSLHILPPQQTPVFRNTIGRLIRILINTIFLKYKQSELSFHSDNSLFSLFIGKINTVVVKDLSRFGRNYIEVGRYIDYIFPMNHIRFIAINDGVDTADRSSTALDMMPIVNLFNEWHTSLSKTR